MLGRKLDIKVQKPRGQTTLQIQIWGIISLSMIFETMVQVLRMMCQVRREESLGHSLTIQHYLMTDKYEQTEMVKSERWSQIQETMVLFKPKEQNVSRMRKGQLCQIHLRDNDRKVPVGFCNKKSIGECNFSGVGREKD